MKKTNQTFATASVLSLLAIATLLTACGGGNNGITDRQHNALKNYDLPLTPIHAVDMSAKSTMPIRNRRSLIHCRQFSS